MFTIHPNGFYSRAELAELLAPAGVNVDHFIARIRARKVLRQLWRGADILDAYAAAPSLRGDGADNDAAALPDPANRGNRGRRGGPRPGCPAGAKLDAYLAELRTKA